ncbi:imidazole glycerol phosphate synthase, glutamine amidotransferase subunit [Psychromonas ingrahamii 37]|uniref:Imidazole glycerol phosphate synthase subunit HisH n=1 Tax=Psychromonas ingrahamii (strain DSM 17664 / CCUG 51855 / 37) TaxID=357804 RepID=A1SVD1_PSYIN|nr:imidazole glycerol phosphate synthase subunit HisH [Psychromonas ingrahamii]ABM03446.1 imidazole glycerol phosphate synthase, glutamine amidotransferase subunit [Psychromonas ingrahamii 37]
MNIVIIDTGCANLSSVRFAIERLGYSVTVSKDPAILQQADKLFLPGVGTAKEAMANLIERNLVEPIKSLTQPVLGICLGMQMLADASEEGFGDQPIIETLGIVEGHIEKMDVAPLRSPHMGWNQITPKLDEPLFKDIPAGSYFYFVHSYALPVNENTIASCEYGTPFTAAVNKDNFYGVQFHPERSGKAGAQLIKNFLEL